MTDNSTKSARLARTLRDWLGYGDDPIPGGLALLEDLRRIGVLPNGHRVDNSALRSKSDHANWDSLTNQLILSETTFEGLKRDEGRALFTLAHEVGHIRHGHNGTYARALNKTAFVTKEDPIEREADEFAAEFLVPASAIKNPLEVTPDEICSRFGVSFTAAQIRHEELCREYRRRNGLKRPLPSNTIDFLAEKKRLGHLVKTELPPEK